MAKARTRRHSNVTADGDNDNDGDSDGITITRHRGPPEPPEPPGKKMKRLWLYGARPADIEHRPQHAWRVAPTVAIDTSGDERSIAAIRDSDKN